MISPLRYLTRSQFWNISISWRKVYVCQSIFELVVCYKQTHITLLCIHIPMWLIPVVRVKFSYSTINENDDNDKSTWMICLRKNVSILRHQFFQLKSETIWSTFTIIHKNFNVKWFCLIKNGAKIPIKMYLWIFKWVTSNIILNWRTTLEAVVSLQ